MLAQPVIEAMSSLRNGLRGRSKLNKQSVPTIVTTPVNVSIVIPIFNEADNLPKLITHVAKLNPPPYQVVLVDGGSTDKSVAMAKALIKTFMCDRQAPVIEWQLIESEAGRAVQMNAGAAQVTGDTLLFLHADTQLPNAAITEIVQSMTYHDWGHFDVRLNSRSPMLWTVSRMMNARSRLTRIATGDQAIFIKKSCFDTLGGYPNQPLMEDIELCKRLKNIARPACLSSEVTTSARRWQKYGTWQTIFLMWRLRFDYWCGVAPELLKQRYYSHSKIAGLKK
ncbi:rSAM/selenodomain-associated transferase 2 [Psychrobacter sp. PL19]